MLELVSALRSFMRSAHSTRCLVCFAALVRSLVAGTGQNYFGMASDRAEFEHQVASSHYVAYIFSRHVALVGFQTIDHGYSSGWVCLDIDSGASHNRRAIGNPDVKNNDDL